MGSASNWRSWRLPSTKYAALGATQNSNNGRSRSSSIGREEDIPLNKETGDGDEDDDLSPTLEVPPRKRSYCRPRLLVAFACLAFLAGGALLGYTAGGLRVWPASGGDSGTPEKATSKSPWGTEYDKMIYPENEYGERYCPDEDLTLRREWRKMSRVEKRQFVQAVKCLTHKPSKTRPTGNMFEDFAFIRGQIGMRSTYPAWAEARRKGDMMLTTSQPSEWHLTFPGSVISFGCLRGSSRTLAATRVAFRTSDPLFFSSLVFLAEPIFLFFLPR